MERNAEMVRIGETQNGNGFLPIAPIRHFLREGSQSWMSTYISTLISPVNIILQVRPSYRLRSAKHSVRGINVKNQSTKYPLTMVEVCHRYSRSWSHCLRTT